MKNEAGSALMVKEIILKEVPDWDDELLARARFKDLSGQRSDWLPQYTFWRDLVIAIARHLHLIAITPSEVATLWFDRRGLTPLCIDQVLRVMCDEGDLVPPTTSFVSNLFSRIRKLVSKPTLNDSRLILVPLLEERADEALKFLSERGLCIVSMTTFRSICGGNLEADAVLNRLCNLGKAQFLKASNVEGVKVSLSDKLAVAPLDIKILKLTYTSEELNMQVGAINQRYETAKKSSLKALKSGDRKAALRHAKEMKMMSESMEKWEGYVNRVDSVLDAIYESETAKKVAEAVRMGAEAMKNNAVNGEEVERCLVEIEERIAQQKEIERALTSFDDDDVEMELEELEMELKEGDELVAAMKKMEVRSSPPEKDEKRKESELILEPNV